MTPKEALIKDGTVAVKAGRGRLSREGIARCKELAAMGWQIDGYVVDKAAPVTTEAPVVNKVKAAGVKEVLDFVIFYPESEFKAVGNDKKVWGMREVCNTCRVSLVQCACGHPTILGNIPVSIVRK